MFKTYKEYENGGKVLIHTKIDKSQTDYKDLLSIANIFAREGKSVKLTPIIHFKSKTYKEIYGSLIGTLYERKCPDLKIGDFFYEYERYIPPFNKKKISHMIKKGTEQSNRIIINNKKGASDRFILRNIKERMADKNFKYEIKEVWLYENGSLRLLFKIQ